MSAAVNGNVEEKPASIVAWRDKNFNYRVNHSPKETWKIHFRHWDTNMQSLKHSLQRWLPVLPTSHHQWSCCQQSQYQDNPHSFQIIRIFAEDSQSAKTTDFLTGASAFSSQTKHNLQSEHKDLLEERGVKHTLILKLQWFSLRFIISLIQPC